MEDIRFANIDSISEEDKKRLSRMLAMSRGESGLSQEAVALELGVAKKTVQNWEKGVSTPTLPQAIAWFRVVRVAAMPYFLQFMFPDMEGIKKDTADKQLRKNLISIMEVVPMDGVRQLLYLFFGNHGSSPRAVLNMITAYLQIPLKDRCKIDTIISTDYAIAQSTGEIVKTDHVQPDKELMERTIKQELDAVLQQKNNYTIL